MPSWRQKSSVMSVRRRPSASHAVLSSGAASDRSPSVSVSGPPKALSVEKSAWLSPAGS
jgi:hypothetical protein